jgi:hypothetical protein
MMKQVPRKLAGIWAGTWEALEFTAAGVAVATNRPAASTREESSEDFVFAERLKVKLINGKALNEYEQMCY